MNIKRLWEIDKVSRKFGWYDPCLIYKMIYEKDIVNYIGVGGSLREYYVMGIDFGYKLK